MTKSCFVILNFLKDKIKKYQEKKLAEAQQKLGYYKKTKNQLELNLQQASEEESAEIKEKISKQNEFIEIWTKNINTINRELKKLKS